MELFKLLGTVAIDNTQANGELDKTAQKANDTANETTDAVKKIGAAGVTIAKGIGTAAVAIGGAWLAAIEGTREYRVSMGKLETAFTTSGHSANTAKATYSELNAVLGDSDVAVEASNHLAKLTDNEKDLQTWTNICTGVFATFGDSLPIEGLTEAANETAKTGVLTGGLTDALNWAGESEEKFQESLDKCTTEQERQSLITSTLNGLYSEAATKYKESNKEVIEAEKAQARLTGAMSELGAIGEPILTNIKNKIADMVAAAVPKLQELVDKFKDGVKWIKDNEETVKTWASVIAGAVVTIGTFILIISWGKIMTAAKNALNGVRLAMIAFNAVMRANPIGLVISIIAGLVTAFILLWKNNESFRKFWINLWDKIKSITKNTVDSVKKWFKDMYDNMKTRFNSMRESAVSIFNKIKSAITTPIESVRKNVSTKFQQIKDSMTDKIESARDAIKKVIDKIKGFFDFKFSLPKIPIPKFKIKPSGWKIGDLLKGEKPSLSIAWNKAGGILTQPTIFGVGQNNLLGGGEAGKEAILPINTLEQYVSNSMLQHNNELIEGIENQITRLITFLQDRIPEDYFIQLDSGVLVGELATGINTQLNDIYKHNNRMNTR